MKKILNFPLVRIIISIMVCVVVAYLLIPLITTLLRPVVPHWELRNFIAIAIASAYSLISYYFLFKYYEKREVTELSKNGLGKSLLMGIFIGFGLQSIVIFLIYIFGAYSVVSINNISVILPVFSMALFTGIVEEVLARGILFRIVEEKLGSYISLIISALIFGFLHLGNSGATLWSAIAIALEAGLLLGIAYIYSRNLWLPIGIHFAWNLTQSGIWGANTSGGEAAGSLITSTIEGPTWLTGGTFGPEGSIISVALCLIATILLFIPIYKQNKIVQPFWERNKIS